MAELDWFMSAEFLEGVAPLSESPPRMSLFSDAGGETLSAGMVFPPNVSASSASPDTTYSNASSPEKVDPLSILDPAVFGKVVFGKVF